MTMRRSFLTLALLATPFFSYAAGGGSPVMSCNTLFGISAISGVQSGQFCTNTAENFVNALKDGGLSNVVSGYNNASAVTVVGRFNYVDINLSYAASGTALSFVIPKLNINLTFDGGSRDASVEQLKDYLKKNDLISQIMKLQAELSPNSPITGAGGLMPTMVSQDFGTSLSGTSKIAPTPQTAANKTTQQVTNLVGMGIGIGNYSTKDVKTSVTTLPLSYTWKSTEDSRRQVTFSLPLSNVDTDGAKSYHAGLGVAMTLPMNERWSLTPAFKYGLTGSKDLATVATLYGGSVTSAYVIPGDKFDLSIGNMVGYYQTGKFSSGDYSFDPGIKNTVFRNGIMLSQPVVWGGHHLAVEYSLIDTRYTGTKLYIDNTQEVGITIGTNRSASPSRSYLRGGLSFFRGKDTNGVNFNFGYWF